MQVCQIFRPQRRQRYFQLFSSELVRPEHVRESCLRLAAADAFRYGLRLTTLLADPSELLLGIEAHVRSQGISRLAADN